MYLAWTSKGGKYFFVKFDAVTRETIDSTLSITTHPVEDGSDTTDHAHAGPDKITLEGYISNVPLPSNWGGEFDEAPFRFMQLGSVPLKMGENPQGVNLQAFGEEPPNLMDSILGAASKVSPGGLTKLVTGGINSLLHKPPDHAMVFKGPDDWKDRARRVYELLRAAQQERVRVVCGTRLVTLEDMLIAKLNVPRSLKDGTGATFSLDLQRVRIVRSATVAAPVPAESRGQAETPAGQKATKEDKEEKKRLQSTSLKFGIWSGWQKEK